MFSMTVMTVDVSLCARLRHDARRSSDSLFVAEPTVEPGLYG